MVKNNLADGTDVKPGKFKFCDTCVEGKQSRDSFNDTRERAKRPLERIHSDICGNIDPVAHDGSKYFVTFIDDYTHFAIVYTITHKSEVFKVFKEYEAMSTALFGNSISKLTIEEQSTHRKNK